MNLNSAGYDAVVLLNERFLNQASGALFYNGFLRIAKDVDLIQMLDEGAGEKIDPSLYHFLKMHVRLHLLHEPAIDFVDSGKEDVPFSMRLLMDLRVIITLWDGLELPFTARMSLTVACAIYRIPETVGEEEINSALLCFDSEYLEPGSQMILMDFADSKVDKFTISWNNTKQQALSVDLERVVNTVVRAWFVEGESRLAFALPSFGVYLPFLEKVPENRFYANIVLCKVIDRETLAIAVNFLDYQGGCQEQLANFARNCSAGIAVPEAAMQKVIDFAWTRMFEGKRYGGTHTFEFEGVDKVTNQILTVAGWLGRIVAEIATLGIVEPHYVFHGLDFVVDYWAELPYKPTIDFLPGNKVKLKNAITRGEFGLRVVLDVETWTDIDVTGFLPDFIPDIEGEHRRYKLDVFNMRLRLNEVGLREATGKAVFNDTANTLTLSLESIDIALDIALRPFAGCPYFSLCDEVREGILNCIERILIDNFPAISIVPPLRAALPGIPWKMNMKGRKLDIQADELTATLDCWFEELKKNMPHVPKYIVNTNNSEIHYLGCSALLDTYEEHQQGFHLLMDAVNEGYDGCGRCIPEYHTR